MDQEYKVPDTQRDTGSPTTA
ncbi:MAG: hypothetical protein H6R33_19, partial [Actinobacteria bacterium]|nr:hypothetical protein [Actinomycetota bacterium]